MAYNQEIEILKPGESGWFRTRDGLIAFAFRVPFEYSPYEIHWWTRCQNGSAYKNGLTKFFGQNPDDLVEHLPECTGFDWKPQPKYIPWTLETMPPQVLVKRISDGNSFAARPATGSTCLIGYTTETYRDLLNSYKQLDGAPCGRLE